MDDLSQLFARIFGRFVGPTDEPEGEPEPVVVGVRLGNHVVPYPARPTRIAAE
jgi:hypothetical protein